jgi:hypothetical protein
MQEPTAPKTTRAKKQTKITPQVEDAGVGEVRSSYIVGATYGLKKITYTAVSGLAVFEGDIILGTVEQMESMKQAVEHPDPNVEQAVAISSAAGSQFRWPGAIVPFEIDGAMPDQQRVRDAINHLEANTNLRFPARTNETNWVRFQGGIGCSSAVGMRGGGAQAITLGPGCDWPRAVHETCHAAGLWHEQSREDRDRFVIIHWDNIQVNTRHNFDQHITDGDDIGPYDYDSLMHYGRRDFAIDSTKDTITPTPDPTRAIGQRTGLSAGDIIAINALYPQKATLGDTSSNGPALVTRNGRVLLGWTGTGNLRLNFMSSSDGLNFGNKVTLGDLSSNALALTVFNGNYVVAWTGVGGNQLNVMQSTDGINWGNKVTLSDTSLSSPALAVLGGQLVIAWRGVGNDRLNVMRSANGTAWQSKVTLNETTTSGPALATLGSRLLLGWRGVGNNQLNVIRSTSGASFSGKVTLGDTTVSKPQLHVRGNRAFLTWQGVGNRFLNTLSSADGSNWGSKFVSREICIDGPALATLGNSLVWGWTGTDAAHHLNTLLFNWV